MTVIAMKAALFFLTFTHVTVFGDNIGTIRRKIEANRSLAHIDRVTQSVATSCPSTDSCKRFLLKGRRIHKKSGSECEAKCSLSHKRALKNDWECGPCPVLPAPTPAAAPKAAGTPVASPKAAGTPVQVVTPTIAAPTVAPVKATVSVPVVDPVKAPVSVPIVDPVKAPVSVPVVDPVKAPVSVPVVDPIKAPVTAPVSAPVKAPVSAPEQFVLKPDSIIINELMLGDGKTTQAWVELFNDTPDTINLKGFSVATSTGNWEIKTDLKIQPSSFAVMKGSTRNGGVVLSGNDFILPGFNLTERDKRIVLYDPSSQPHDVVALGNGITFNVDSYLDTSFALIHPSSANGNIQLWQCYGNFYYANGRQGTPGEYNNCPPPDGTLKITEIMTETDDGYSWFEVQNTGVYDLNLKNWKISTASGGDWTIMDQLVLAPGGMEVFGGDNAFPTTQGEATYYWYILEGFALDAEGDSIILETAEEVKHEKVKWFPTFDGWDMPAGSSVAVYSTENDNSDPANWCVSKFPYSYSAENFGSPGSANDCLLPENSLVINEIMVKDSWVAGATLSWIELHNKGSFSVNMDGWSIITTDNTILMSDAITIPAYGYIVLGNQEERSIFGESKSYRYFFVQGVTLHQEKDTIQLLTPRGKKHDIVEWNGKEEWAMFEAAGSSVALKSPLLDNRRAESWCLSTPLPGSITGTPGGPNDCPEIVINEIMFAPDDEGDGGGQWVELYNAGDYTVSLKGWSMVYEYETTTVVDIEPKVATAISTTSATFLDVTIEPEKYIVVGNTGRSKGKGERTLASQSTLDNLSVVQSTLDNLSVVQSKLDLPFTMDTEKAGSIHLSSPQGEIMASYAWTPPDLNGAFGRSLSLRSPDLDSEMRKNWCISSQTYFIGSEKTGTPGKSNDCPNILVTEVMIDPVATDCDCLSSGNIRPALASIAVACPCAPANEWMEVYNPTAYPVNLLGWTLVFTGGQIEDESMDGNRIPIGIPGLPLPITIGNSIIVPANGYVVIGKDFESKLFDEVDDQFSTFDIALLSIDIAKGSVYLIAPDKFYQTGVAWDETVNPGWTQFPGVSMALRSINKPAEKSTSWCRSETVYKGDVFGTPGKGNDC